MFDKFLARLFGTKHERAAKKLWPLVAEINAIEDEYQKLSDEELRAKTDEFKERIGVFWRSQLRRIDPEAYRRFLSGKEVEYFREDWERIQKLSVSESAAESAEPALLTSDAEFPSLSPDEQRARATEFSDWAQKHKARGLGAFDTRIQSSRHYLAKGIVAILKERESLNDLLPEAFAAVKNACRRLIGHEYQVRGRPVTWDMIPYDEQLIGGIVLHQGKIAEMATGEGKTLVAVLPL